MWRPIVIGLGAMLCTVGLFVLPFAPGADTFGKWIANNPIFAVLSLGATIVSLVQGVELIRPRPAARRIDCNLCSKSGKIRRPSKPRIAVCEVCQGLGHIATDRVGQPDCRFCSGSGRDPDPESEVPVPCRICDGIGLEPIKRRGQPPT